jgi:hypothetical protein
MSEVEEIKEINNQQNNDTIETENGSSKVNNQEQEEEHNENENIKNLHDGNENLTINQPISDESSNVAKVESENETQAIQTSQANPEEEEKVEEINENLPKVEGSDNQESEGTQSGITNEEAKNSDTGKDDIDKDKHVEINPISGHENGEACVDDKKNIEKNDEVLNPKEIHQPENVQQNVIHNTQAQCEISSITINNQNNQSDNSIKNSLSEENINKKKIIQLSSYYTSVWEEFWHKKKREGSNYVELDITDITTQLSGKTNEYKTENVNIKFSKNFFQNIYKERIYLSHLKNNNFSYNGVLNQNFERSIVGRNDFSTNDVYIGEWKEDLKVGFGVYFYNPVGKEFYAGQFVENGKKQNGFYFKKPGENSSFDAFYGVFDDKENLQEGTLISTNDNYSKSYIYKGRFVENKKDDDGDGYYYLFNSRLLFIGQFKDDKIVSGHLFQLTEENQIISVVKYDNTGKNVKKELIREDEMDKQISKAERFLYDVCANEKIEHISNLAEETFKLEENWRFERLISDDDVDNLKNDLDSLDIKIQKI